MKVRPTAEKAVLCAVLMAFVPTVSAAEEAEGVLRRAATVMGAGDLKTIRFSGSGTGSVFGQAYQPGKAWPKIDIQSQVRTINYASGSMRESMHVTTARPFAARAGRPWSRKSAA